MSDPGTTGRRLATALLATVAVYGGYALLGLVPGLDGVRGLALIAAFYFLPQRLLRRDPERATAWGFGPDGPMPPWSRGAAVTALLACAVVFPPFALGFWWFYDHLCGGDLTPIAPALWIERLTPIAGTIEAFVARLCHTHGGGFLPDALRVPDAWRELGGLGGLYAIAVGVFAVALPEELFHRAYLLNVLEERWPPRTRVLGVPFGLAAVLASLVFAVGHLAAMAEPARLTTFFPALFFAWLYRRSGSVWAPTLFHAASNLLMDVLLASTFGRG